MKNRTLALALALLGFVGSAIAQQMFIPDDTDGCQTYAPFVWTDLVPGAKWQATVDLSQCTSADLGWYKYYGYIVRNNRADTLKNRDGIVLKALNLSTGELFGASGDRNAAEQSVLVMVDRPGMFLLSAENTGRNTAKIRLTWVK